MMKTIEEVKKLALDLNLTSSDAVAGFKAYFSYMLIKSVPGYLCTILCIFGSVFTLVVGAKQIVKLSFDKSIQFQEAKTKAIQAKHSP